MSALSRPSPASGSARRSPRHSAKSETKFAPVPGVERIGGFKAWVEPRRNRCLRLIRYLGKANAGAVGQINQQFAFAARIADRDEAARRGAAPGGEEQQGSGELIERLDADDAVAIEQRVIGEIAARQRAGVSERAAAAAAVRPTLSATTGTPRRRRALAPLRSPVDRAPPR